MRHVSRSLASISIALAFTAVPAAAERSTAPKDKESDLDPQAMEALDRMGAYLRTLKTFEVNAETTDEDVLHDGEKVHYVGKTHLLAKRPGRFRAEVSNDRYDRLYLYDGKNLTLFAKRLNFYSTVPAPSTIGKLADKLERNYGIPMPLVDFFRWGSPGWRARGITAATDLGPSEVEGTTCEHYAFREKDIDWQIWIQQGPNPLPRRLVITTKTDTARPQHTAVYTWNLAPSFNDRSFTFQPPKGSAKVPMAEVETMRRQAQRRTR